ncbi:hypothetical protein CYY_006928 [Polysphondylium violaceum]|uniref:G-protein coupled receptors family 3 profile domain-containing protein n=1 Tax=Polysphondylium violaceum TaxID=133409 RepID=A0A8J4V2P0_9MYCE|nr:hypothetical protein CYY_006928 [Polysphondylium violaceum]
MKNNIILFLILFFITLAQSAPPLKFAVLQNGDSSDLGFNYMVNDGRIYVEDKFNTTSTKSLYDVTEFNAYDKFVELIDQGYNLIVASSLEYGNAVYKAAANYPNVKFLTRGRGNSTMANLARISYNVQSADYMAGYFAGMNTNTNIVGIVIPGQSFNTYHHANSFAMGVKAASRYLGKDIKIYCASTNSYNDYDIAVLATQTILAKGADILSQIQNDMTVSLTSMNAGNLGIGTNGFLEKRIYGEKVGTSYVINWGRLFYEAANRFVNDNWTVGWSFLGDFNNEVLNLDTFSFRVPTDRAALIRAEEKKFKDDSNYSPQYCEPISCQVFNCTKGCASYAEWSTATVFVPNIEYLGQMEIPLTQVEFSNGARITFSVIATLFGTIILLGMLGVCVYRNTLPIRSASPIFCNAIFLGGLFIFAGVAIWITAPTTALCRLRYWMVSLGYTIMLGSMVVKNVRIYMLFNNKELKVLNITNSKLFPYVALALLINIILLIIWTTLGDVSAINRRSIDDIGKYEYLTTCYISDQGNIALYILLVYHGLMLLLGCLVSFKIRTVDIQDFNESKAIASILYAIAFCLFIVIPLLISSQKVFQQVIVLASSFSFTAASGLLILFVPKFIRIFVNNKGDRSKSSFSSKLSQITPTHDTLSYFPDEEIPNEYSKKPANATAATTESSTVPTTSQVVSNESNIQSGITDGDQTTRERPPVHQETFSSDESSSDEGQV